MRLDPAQLLGSCGAVLLFVSSCLFGSAHEQCHRKALEQPGCCPFHGDECESDSLDSIRKACAEELEPLSAAEDEGPVSEPEDVLGGETGEDGSGLQGD